MDANRRELVRRRAAGCCEYCGLSQAAVPFASFHIEHVVARQHGGSDDPENLALACDRCNLYKGPNLTAIDPQTNEVVPLFHPRRQSWEDHFQLQGATILGLTPTGRATIRLLNMNASRRVQLRTTLLGTDRPH